MEKDQRSGDEQGLNSKEKQFVGGLEDRICLLPNPILQLILCYLPTKQSFQSSTLSKSWRYICWTRPKLDLRESFFNGNGEAFFSFLETSLSRYRDQNISLPEFVLEISSKVDSEFRVPLGDMGVKKFSLSLNSDCDFAVLIKAAAESLEELNLSRCNLNHINKDKVMLNHLRKLSLSQVDVSEVTLERIISSCPLIQHLDINQCYGFEKIKVDHAALRRFDFVAVGLYWGGTIEIDVPNIECVRIRYCLCWHHSAHYLSFSHIKSLHLAGVLLTNNSFHRFSVDFCCLEELTILDCLGFDEIKLASRSIKNLSLYLDGLLKQSTIDVPTMRSFELSSVFLPSFSFTLTTEASSVCKSKIIAQPFRLLDRLDDGPSSILLDIYNLHKAALSHSEFSLHIASPFGLVTKNVVDSPVVVENLTMDVKMSVFPLEAWLGHLFCFFRPRNIHHFWYTNPQNYSQGLDNLLVSCLRDYFLVKDNLNQQGGLEQVLVEEEEDADDNQKIKIRFRLKWRGESA